MFLLFTIHQPEPTEPLNIKLSLFIIFPSHIRIPPLTSRQSSPIDLPSMVHSENQNRLFCCFVEDSVIAHSQRPLAFEWPDKRLSSLWIPFERLDFCKDFFKNGGLSSFQTIKVFRGSPGKLDGQERFARFWDRSFCAKYVSIEIVSPRFA